MKKLFCCPAYELFSCLPPLFSCLPFKKTVRLPGKKLQNATNWTFNPFCHCTMGVNLSFLIYCASFSSAKPCHLCHLATTLHQRFDQKRLFLKNFRHFNPLCHLRKAASLMSFMSFTDLGFDPTCDFRFFFEEIKAF